MRAERVERAGPHLARGDGGEELGRLQRAAPGLLPHLGDCQQAVVAVEGRVLHALGGHGPAQLREAAAQLEEWPAPLHFCDRPAHEPPDERPGGAPLLGIE